MNKYWRFTQIGGKTVTMVSGQEKEQGFMFRSNGTITGFAGCNNFFGSYTLPENNNISIGKNLGMTMKACPDINVNDQQITGLLTIVNTYEIKGNTLFLRDNNNKLLATLETN